MMYRILFLAVTCADIAAKYLAERFLTHCVLIPGVLGLRLVRNTGVAFSFFSFLCRISGVISLLLMTLALAAMRRYDMKPLFRTGAVLMIAGAFSNMLERLAFGFVTDMIEILAFRFAVFNLADCAVCIGCGIMILSLLGKGEAVWKKK